MVGEKKLENLIVGVHYRHPLKHDEEYVNYLSNTLKIIKKENKNVIITGDFNYNLLNYQKDKKVNNFLSILLENLYLPHITGPTHVTEQNPSLIDNIFFNNLNKECTSGNLLYKLSDHLPSFIFIDETDYTKKVNSNIFKRDFSKFNQENFNKALSDKTIMENINNSNNTNVKYEILHKHIVSTLDDQAPYKKITKKIIKQQQKPWITSGILKSINKKNRLYKKFVKTQDKQYYIKYKYYRETLNRLIRKNKRNYYNQYFTTNINNIKKIWRGINELTNRKGKKKENTICLNINNEIISDPSKVANHFNKFFTSVAKNLADKLKISEISFDEYLKAPIEKSIFIQPTCKEEVNKVILSID